MDVVRCLMYLAKQPHDPFGRFTSSLDSVQHPSDSGHCSRIEVCCRPQKATLAAEVQCGLAPISFTLRHNQSDIVLLFLVTEFLYIINDRRYQGLWREFSIPLPCLDQALFAEFSFRIVERFGYAVGVKYECVSWEKLALPHRTIPLSKKAHYCTG